MSIQSNNIDVREQLLCEGSEAECSVMPRQQLFAIEGFELTFRSVYILDQSHGRERGEGRKLCSLFFYD